MDSFIQAVKNTRQTASQIIENSLKEIDGVSELELKEKILVELAKSNELHDKGWYDPPEDGIAVLFDEAPFTRLKFDTLRKPISWPQKKSKFKKESVGIIYLSPVDRKTSMIGDIGLSIYCGDDEEIKTHIQKCYDTTLKIAEHAKVGMKFSELYQFATDLFKEELQIIGWMTTNSDPRGVNLGHTVPGSFEKNFSFGNSFEETKNTITTKRIYINDEEEFEIPPTCAFTVETRLTDSQKVLPNIFFHFIVTFDNGRKEILKNFDHIFKTANMEYIL